MLCILALNVMSPAIDISSCDYCEIRDEIKGAFFWGYSGIGILRIDGNRVLLGNGIPCILLFVNRNKNNRNSPNRMRPKFRL